MEITTYTPVLRKLAKPVISSLMTYAKAKQIDPTRTTALRNAFAREMENRFTRVAKAVRQAIVRDDVFGTKPQVFVGIPTTPGSRAFSFPRSEDKVNAFMEWLTKLSNDEILSVSVGQQLGGGINNAWTNLYVNDSYKRGVIRAREELKSNGANVPTLDETGGIGASMSTPFHMDRVGVLYTRTYEDLKGVTSTMSSQISRVLGQGMIDGDGPKFLADKLVKVITGAGGDLGLTDTLGRFIPASRRAVIIARTEVIRAHHLGMIQEYRNWGLAGVQVQAEFTTAGDDRVCPICQGLQGQKYTLDQIESMIPVHPQCRCIALPYMSDEELFKDNRGAGAPALPVSPTNLIGDGPLMNINPLDSIITERGVTSKNLKFLDKEMKKHLTLETLDPSKIIASEWNNAGVSAAKLQKMALADLSNTSPIIVHRLKDGTMEVLNGIHRVEAAKLQDASIRALVYDDYAYSLVEGILDDTQLEALANYLGRKYNLAKVKTILQTPQEIIGKAIPTTAEQQLEYVTANWDNVVGKDLTVSYADLMGKFNLKELEDNIRVSLMEHGMDPKFNRSLFIRRNEVMLEFKNEQFAMTRTFSFQGKDLVVDHDLFKVNEAFQGHGVSKAIFKDLYKQYQAVDIKIINVHANINVGGYTWARYGATTRYDDVLYTLLENNKRKPWYKQAKGIFDNFREQYGEFEPFPMSLWADSSFGREMLLNSDWGGQFILTNGITRTRFEEYLTSSTRTKFKMKG